MNCEHNLHSTFKTFFISWGTVLINMIIQERKHHIKLLERKHQCQSQTEKAMNCVHIREISYEICSLIRHHLYCDLLREYLIAYASLTYPERIRKSLIPTVFCKLFEPLNLAADRDSAF